MSDQPQHYLPLEFFTQVSESIKSVFDITSRIDERTKIIMEKQADVDKRLEEAIKHINSISSRVLLLESKDERAIKEMMERHTQKISELEKHLEIIKLHTEGSDGKWKQVISFGAQIVLAFIAAYFALKLGTAGKP